MSKKNLSAIEKKKRINTLCHEVLTSDAGKELFAMLVDDFICETPVASYDYTEAKARFREGQNDMIRFIISCANEATKESNNV